MYEDIILLRMITLQYLLYHVLHKSWITLERKSLMYSSAVSRLYDSACRFEFCLREYYY